MKALLPLIMLAACSDYSINPESKGNAEPDTGALDDDDPMGGDGGGGDGGADGGGTTSGGACSLELPPSIAVDLNDTCDVPLAEGSFTPVIEWELSGYNAYGPPAVANLDDDDGDGIIGSAGDIPEVVYSTNTGQGLIAVNGRTGVVKWTNTAVPDPASGTAIGDLDGDGIPEIVATNTVNQVVAINNTGTTLWTATVDPGDLDWFAYPSIADLDGDGLAEVIVGRTILDNRGNRVGTGAHGVGGCMNQGYPSYREGSISVPVDLDGDGIMEVVVGNAAYRKDGSTLWANGGEDGIPAVADMDLDGFPEIVVGNGNRVWTLETDGTPTGWSDSFASTNYLGPPAIDDLDGDGAPDMVIVGSGEMRAYRWDGSRLWTRAVNDASGAAGPILFDFELDGYPEVVYADETTVRVFNGLDGSIKLESSAHASYTGFETPVVADVDNDGEVEIVMLHGSSGRGLSVYGDADHSWPAGRPVWNQHAYSITNIEDNAAIPMAPLPNWNRYNNFRSGDAGLPPSEWDDLSPEIVEVCIDECPDTLWLTVRVWNQGTVDVDAGVPVIVVGSTTGVVAARATITTPIASGRSSAGVLIEVDVDALGGETPIVALDDTVAPVNILSDCYAGNDVDLFPSACR